MKYLVGFNLVLTLALAFQIHQHAIAHNAFVRATAEVVHKDLVWQQAITKVVLGR